MNWRDISGGSVLIPQEPKAIIHFLGGAFVAGAPQVTYRWLLEELSKAGYVIVATPFINTFDHKAIARTVLNRFDNILDRLQRDRLIQQSYLPIYGIGHSMGCKLHLLIGSFYRVERSGNILISYNNFPVNRAIPFGEQLNLNSNFNLEFSPSPQETNELIASDYQVRRNLLVRFQDDEIDQTLYLNPILKKRFPEMISMLTIPGNHLTPLTQELKWQAGDIFTPFDAVGQLLKQTFSKDLTRLKQEVQRWLNPLGV
jgi:hypothetical protein